MHLFTFDTVPTAEHPDFAIVEGAIVSAWISSANFSAREDAESRARAAIEIQDWFIKELDRYTRLDLTTYEPRDEDREYFDAAMAGEDVLVFYTYPDGTDDETGSGEPQR